MNEQLSYQRDNEHSEHEQPPGSHATGRHLFLGCVGLNKYAVIGILAITLGTLLMTGLIDRPELLILGGLTNGIGLLVMTVGSFISSKKDKSEVIDRIKMFREELVEVKSALSSGDSLGAMEKIENEFSGWAEAFLTNLEGKIVERQKSEVLLREAEIDLSRKWRHVYEYAFDTLRQMLTAYNEKACASIAFTIPALPFNLFGEEAQSFRSFVEFDKAAVWRIKLSITRPHREESLPSIVISYYIGEPLGDDAAARARKDGGAEFLLLSIDPKDKRIKLHTSSRDLYVGNTKPEYSIHDKDYRLSVKELFTTLVEHQIITLLKG